MFVIKAAFQTVFFRQFGLSIKQLVRLVIDNNETTTSAFLRVRSSDHTVQRISVTIPAGESELDVFVPDSDEKRILVFTLTPALDFAKSPSDDVPCRYEMLLQPQRKWIIHVVQTSHHDPGYTDLPSLVLRQHDQWLDEAIDMAEQTDHFSEDAKFRIVIEQAWSIDHFLRNATPERAEKAIALMRSGRFELTALFGNMTSEICGHEALIRTTYMTFALKRKYGIPIATAEHNDITGISWGLSRVLADAGIKLFCPGIPLYYSWGNKGMSSFWDEKKIFGREGPGAFWWETPDKSRVLFWCNNTGCGGSPRHTLPDLESTLQRLEKQGYPWPILRWPVNGGARDNSPYLEGYAHTIKQWNEKWAFPHLVCSTNTRFYEDLIKQDLVDLPVWRGELPGQDYPSGATSTAAATAANRNAHYLMQSAEKLSSAASIQATFQYPKEILVESARETLWHDEHAWGFHFPCGPAMHASQQEKALHAYRALALAHGAAAKAMAVLADNIILREGYSLVVFNPTSWPCTGAVRMPMREMDNSGSEMRYVTPEKDPQGSGFLKGYVLGHRFHTNLPDAILDGCFELIEVDSGDKTPFQMLELSSGMEPLPYSEDRFGIGSGTSRYGLFENPIGLKRDLCFVAVNVPAMGYKTYEFLEKKPCTMTETVEVQNGGSIENEYYLIESNEQGLIVSLFDKAASRELIDANNEHGFFNLVVRHGNAQQGVSDKGLSMSVQKGSVCSKITISSQAPGHPAIQKTMTLFRGLKLIFLDIKILKDPTPLLNVHLAFPFAATSPVFRYEGSLAQINPVQDYLPGSFMDTVAVQSWVKLTDVNYTILLSSLDAPIMGLSQLWPGYVSPAHRCILDDNTRRLPQDREDLIHGWIYSQLFNNNFGTNFSVSQTGETLFRYVLKTECTSVQDDQASRFGWQAMEPLLTMLTDRRQPGCHLPPVSNFIVIDNPTVAILDWKQADHDEGHILRLWNLSDVQQRAVLTITGCTVSGLACCNIVEEAQEERSGDEDGFVVCLKPMQIVTLHVAKVKRNMVVKHIENPHNNQG